MKPTVKTFVATAAFAIILGFGAHEINASTIGLDATNTSALGGLKADGTYDSFVVCSIFCQGWDANAEAWGDVATAFQPPANVNTIKQDFGTTGLVTTGTNADPLFNDYKKIDDYNANISSFFIDTVYFHVFDASNRFLFRTFSDEVENPGLQTFTFFKMGEESRPSNVGATGDISPVPLPAAAWLLLSGLGGLALLRRRRKDA